MGELADTELAGMRHQRQGAQADRVGKSGEEGAWVFHDGKYALLLI